MLQFLQHMLCGDSHCVCNWKMKTGSGMSNPRYRAGSALLSDVSVPCGWNPCSLWMTPGREGLIVKVQMFP